MSTAVPMVVRAAKLLETTSSAAASTVALSLNLTKPMLRSAMKVSVFFSPTASPKASLRRVCVAMSASSASTVRLTTTCPTASCPILATSTVTGVDAVKPSGSTPGFNATMPTSQPKASMPVATSEKSCDSTGTRDT